MKEKIVLLTFQFNDYVSEKERLVPLDKILEDVKNVVDNHLYNHYGMSITFNETKIYDKVNR